MNPFSLVSKEVLSQTPDYIFVPAGSSYEIDSKLKHNLKLGEKSSLENILDISLQLRTKVVTTVKDSDELRKKYRFSNNIAVLESRENLIDSAIFGLVEGYINYFCESKYTKSWANLKKIKLFLKENPHFENLTMLCVGSDSPFIKKEDLEQFIANYNSFGVKPDIFIGMTNMEKLNSLTQDLELDISKIESTIKNYCITDKGLLRISNIYIIKPFKILNSGLAGVMQKIYDNRKLSQGITQYLGILNGLNSIFTRVAMHPFASMKFSRDLYVISKHFQGKNYSHAIELDKALENTSKIIGLDIKADINCSLRSLLDIDDDATYHFFKENFEDLTRYLQK